MAETSLPWDGITTGDATLAPYDAPTEQADIYRDLAGAAQSTDKSGVVDGELNNLNITTPGSASISVDTGAAIVYGTLYRNSAPVVVAIPTPGGASRPDRIVLRKDWTLQTVRVVRIAGTEGGAPPAVQSTPGDKWDEILATVLITTGGVITISNDERSFLPAMSQPVVQVYRNAALTINNAGSGTVYIPWDSLNFGVLSPAAGYMWDVSVPTDLVIKRSGLWEVYGKITYDAQANIGSFTASLLRGAALTLTDSVYHSKTTAALVSVTLPLYTQVVLSVGDILRISTVQITGANIPLVVGNAYNRLGARLLQKFSNRA